MWRKVREALARWVYPEVFFWRDNLEDAYNRMVELVKKYEEELGDCEDAHLELQKALSSAEAELSALKTQVDKALLPYPKSVRPVGTITATELHDLLADAGFRDIEVADSRYYVLDIAEMDEIVRGIYRMNANKVKYVKQIWDCDDYAELIHVLVAYSMYLSGHDLQVAFGEGWSTVHAYNVAVVSDAGVYRVVAYEPQTGRRVSELEGVYSPKEAFFTT